ncbi:hypothetical protein MKW92_008888, partial [Papaver armeniacum]
MDEEMGEEGNKDKGERKDHDWYLPLYKAAKEGDWQKAADFISDVGRDAVIAPVTFVMQLVILMTPEQLEITNDDGDTALQIAVLVGNIESIKAMVERNKKLTEISDQYGVIPIVNAGNYASRKGKKDIIKYLYRVMKDDSSLFSGDLGCRIICSVIGAGFYDVACDMIKTYPDLAVENRGRYCALEMMAASPNAFLSKSQPSFWNHFAYSCMVSKLNHYRRRSFLDRRQVFKTLTRMFGKGEMVLNKVQVSECLHLLPIWTNCKVMRGTHPPVKSQVLDFSSNTLFIRWVEDDIRKSVTEVGPSVELQKINAVYIKNFPKYVTEDKVREAFEYHGDITKVVLPPANPGQEKYIFGFVHYAERSTCGSLLVKILAMGEAAKCVACAMMSQLSGHGVKLDIPSLLKGTE